MSLLTKLAIGSLAVFAIYKATEITTAVPAKKRALKSKAVKALAAPKKVAARPRKRAAKPAVAAV